jgi:DNA uptake protein ComE-like DNA-binding protein
MSLKVACLALTMIGTLSGAAFAQSSPTPPHTAKPGTTAAAQPARINVNTASADELGKTLRLSPGTATAIVEARKKAPFKDWNDLVARRVLPSAVKNDLRERVTF